ncbi:MAG: hypothetical protein ACP5HK_04715 [Acidilobus sp.]
MKDLLEYSVDKVAHVLEEHRQLVLNVTEAVNQALAVPEAEREQVVTGIRDLLNSLMGAREGLLKSGSEYVKIVRCCLRRDESLEALFSYYVMAGHKMEQEAVKRAGGLIEIMDDLNHIRDTTSSLQQVLIEVSGLRGQASR